MYVCKNIHVGLHVGRIVIVEAMWTLCVCQILSMIIIPLCISCSLFNSDVFACKFIGNCSQAENNKQASFEEESI